MVAFIIQVRTVILHFSFFFLFSSSHAFSQDIGNPPEAAQIEDNSFLIEEAYNQEEGVVQHINNFQFMNKHLWYYSFTQEWPVPDEKNQLSVTFFVYNTEKSTGVGDVLINYRYQAVLKKQIAFSPRFSLVFPTGNYRISAGTGTLGYQVSLPVSLTLGPKIVTHYNVGVTFTPGAKAPDGVKSNLTILNYGTSLVWLTRETFNLMLEMVGYTAFSKETGIPTGINNYLILNPGFRYAINFDNGLQIVPGLAIPVSLAPLDGNWGVFLYLSFEGLIWNPKSKK
jgi:hypothetical protein